MIRHGNLSVPVIGVANSGWTLDQLRDRARASLQGVRRRRRRGGLRQADVAAAVHRRRLRRPRHVREAAQGARRRQAPDALPRHPAQPVRQRHRALGKSGCAGRRPRRRREAVRPRPRDRARAQPDPPLRLPESRPSSASTTISARKRSRTCCSSASPTRSSSRSGTATTWIPSRSRWPKSSASQGRGKFYDETGAIRDVIQNHLLQVVGYLAMEPPNAVDADRIRDEQVKIFRAIKPLKPENVVRGQFTRLPEEPGVAPGSTVETFAAVRLEIDSWRWAGVPFLIRAGKCLPLTATEVMVDLKRPPLSRLSPEESNYFRFRLGPEDRDLARRPRQEARRGDGVDADGARRGARRRPRRGRCLRAPADRRDGGRPDAVRPRGRRRGGVGASSTESSTTRRPCIRTRPGPGGRRRRTG